MENSLFLFSVQNSQAITTSPYFIIFTSLLSGLIGSFLTVCITRKDAKKRLTIDIATQELYPKLYIPLINEYQRVVDIEISGATTSLRVKEIEKIIMENALIINFAPQNIKTKINSIYSQCKVIDTPAKYAEKIGRIRKELKELKEEINNTFEGYLK